MVILMWFSHSLDFYLLLCCQEINFKFLVLKILMAHCACLWFGTCCLQCLEACLLIGTRLLIGTKGVHQLWLISFSKRLPNTINVALQKSDWKSWHKICFLWLASFRINRFVVTVITIGQICEEWISFMIGKNSETVSWAWTKVKNSSGLN